MTWKSVKNLSMKDLMALRSEMDHLHNDFFDLVCKRFEITAQIWRHKQNNQIHFVDEERELQLIHQFDDHFNSEVDRQAFQAVMKSLIAASKRSAEGKI